EVDRRRTPRAAGRVDHDVDFAKGFNSARESMLQRLLAGDIRSDSKAPATELFDLGARGIDLFGAARRWHYIGPGFGQPSRDRKPNPRSPSYHHRGPPAQIKRRITHSFFSAKPSPLDHSQAARTNLTNAYQTKPSRRNPKTLKVIPIYPLKSKSVASPFERCQTDQLSFQTNNWCHTSGDARARLL